MVKATVSPVNIQPAGVVKQARRRRDPADGLMIAPGQRH